MVERLSHAYCRPCDVIFPTSIICPRCQGHDILSPPQGAPTPKPQPAKGRDRGRKWIAHQGYDHYSHPTNP